MLLMRLLVLLVLLHQHVLLLELLLLLLLVLLLHVCLLLGEGVLLLLLHLQLPLRMLRNLQLRGGLRNAPKTQAGREGASMRREDVHHAAAHAEHARAAKRHLLLRLMLGVVVLRRGHGSKGILLRLRLLLSLLLLLLLSMLGGGRVRSSVHGVGGEGEFLRLLLGVLLLMLLLLGVLLLPVHGIGHEQLEGGVRV